MKLSFQLTAVLSILAAALICTSCSKKTAKVDSVSGATENRESHNFSFTDVTAASVIEDIVTFQGFTSEPIPEEDLTKILNAGINSQSAINMQPWHFSVVSNQDILKDIGEKMKANMPKMPPKGDKGDRPSGDEKVPPAGDRPTPPKGDMPAPPAGAPKGGAKAGMGDSPVAIIISAKEGSNYDAGLATQLMTVEATLLGYGTKIITSPTIVLNGPDKEEYKSVFGIPEDMSAVGVILIGNYDKTQLDAVTSATTRKDKSEIVSFIK